MASYETGAFLDQDMSFSMTQTNEAREIPCTSSIRRVWWGFAHRLDQKTVKTFILITWVHHLHFLCHRQGCYQRGLEITFESGNASQKLNISFIANQNDFGKERFQFSPHSVLEAVRACSTCHDALCSRQTRQSRDKEGEHNFLLVDRLSANCKKLAAGWNSNHKLETV